MQLLSTLLLIAVVLFITLLHELGHLILAKFLNVPVATFAVGFGPNLISYKDKKNTNWCINLIPLGGYISIAQDGENDVDTMLSISPIKRLIVALGGPFVNILTFFLIGSIFYNKIGAKTQEYTLNQEKNFLYFNGEEYLSFNSKNNSVNLYKTLPKEITFFPNKIINNPLSFKQSYFLCKYQLLFTSKKILTSFSSIENIKKLQSIIVAQKNINQSLNNSNNNIFIIFLYYVMMFSLSIGLFNLLPFFGLDGGWVLISFINIFIKFSKKGERLLIRTLHYGTIMLFVFSGILLFRDILNIIMELLF